MLTTLPTLCNLRKTGLPMTQFMQVILTGQFLIPIALFTSKIYLDLMKDIENLEFYVFLLLGSMLTRFFEILKLFTFTFTS